jgi:predicted tellurium resistance membrane protein TerC
MAEYFTAQHLIAFATLLLLEIVLGIDNIIFIAILTAKLPVAQQSRARLTGIGLAVVSRLLLLLSIAWIMRLTAPVFTIFGNGISGRDLILLFGGLFLIGKSVHEIHEKLEAPDHDREAKVAAAFASVIAQIILIDIIFSLDSVITAVGLSGELFVMVPAVVAAAGVMLAFAGSVSRFVEKHPTMKMLALSFLILIGAVLMMEGWNPEAVHELHLKNYVYFAMAFAVGIEMLNMRMRRLPAQPVQLRNQPTLAQLPDTHQELAGDYY